MKSLKDQRYGAVIDRLKKARLDGNLTQVEVAKRISRPQSFLSKIETLERRLDVIELYDLMKIYGLKWDDVFDPLWL